MSYPTTIDSFSTKVNGNVIDASDIDNVQTAVVSLETKVGITSSADTSSLDYIIRHLPLGNISATGTRGIGTFLRGDGAWASVITFDGFGSGSDTTVAFDGVNTFVFASLSSNVYTLTRDVFASTIVVSSGVTINTAGYALYSAISITNAGTIQNNGSAGASTSNNNGAVGGAGAPGGTLAAGTAGAAGGNKNVAGTNGTSKNPSLGSNGAAGGGSSVGPVSGGSGGTATGENAQFQQAKTTSAATITAGTPLSLTYLYEILGVTSGVALSPSAGSGGGAGGGSNGQTAAGGGGGGGSGGQMLLASQTITNSGTIQANGGAGGNGGTDSSGGGGGGGGGSGGVIAMIYITLANTGTIQAAGGAAGTGGPSTTAAGAGNAGKIYQVSLASSLI